MIGILQVDPSDAAPVWRQIEDGVRRLVASASLAPGAPVPSVRDLAKALRVNPATVAKAYQRLGNDGVLAVRRGEGTFVADAPPAMGDAERERVVDDAAGRYVSIVRTVGGTQSDAARGVAAAWNRLVGPGRSGEGA